MNTSSRVPGLTRNSGWGHVDAEIAAYRLGHQQGTGDLGRVERVGSRADETELVGPDPGARRPGRL